MMFNTHTSTLTNNVFHSLVFSLALLHSTAFVPDSAPMFHRTSPVNMKVLGTTYAPTPGRSDYLSGLPNDTPQPVTETKKVTSEITNTPIVDTSIVVQGGSLRTWSYRSPLVEHVQVTLSSDGRPLDADLELWHGPDNTPCKMRVYVENGHLRPFSAVIATPRGPNTIAIRNIGQIEFPLGANVYAKDIELPSDECTSSCRTIQGGALRTYPFDPLVNSVQVLLKTDGRPLNARIELLQGPNSHKQVVELYTEDGFARPFFCVIETPGSGNVVRVVNTAPVEFPMGAAVVPHEVDQELSSYSTLGDDVVLGGDLAW